MLIISGLKYGLTSSTSSAGGGGGGKDEEEQPFEKKHQQLAGKSGAGEKEMCGLAKLFLPTNLLRDFLPRFTLERWISSAYLHMA